MSPDSLMRFLRRYKLAVVSSVAPADPRVALVIGWDDDATAQIEGVADFPDGTELERMRQVYFAADPDGRERLAWPGITHVRVRPRRARYSDFTKDPPEVAELAFENPPPASPSAAS